MPNEIQLFWQYELDGGWKKLWDGRDAWETGWYIVDDDGTLTGPYASYARAADALAGETDSEN